MVNRFLAVMALLGLAACGGSGGQSFATRQQATLDIFERISMLDGTAASLVPTSGQARYDGIIGFGVVGGSSDGTILLGDMTMDADFGNNRVSGSGTRFVDDASISYVGALTIADGEIVRTGPAAGLFGGNLDGELTPQGGAAMQVDAQFAGVFFGPSAQAAGAVVSGTVTQSGSTGGIEEGVIAVED